jgi:putative oxidoreductase
MKGFFKRWLQHKYFLTITRLFIVLLFFSSAIVKIIYPFQFLVALESYEILPFSAAVLIATYLPWLEGVSAVAFVFNEFRKAAGILIILMLVLFVGAISLALYKHLEIECGCFGTMFTEKVGFSLLLRDFILIALVLNILISDIRIQKESAVTQSAGR